MPATARDEWLRLTSLLRVRGLLLTRDGPRLTIKKVAGFPALRWIGGSGRRRWTPIVFLMTPDPEFREKV
jgi:hypothetical protein